MGREIRRVPFDWQHPRDDNGNFIPLMDKEYDTEKAEWISNLLAWEDGSHPDLQDHPERKEEYDYWEWDQNPPERKHYRPKFESDPVGYQIYENVSEGTPVSPVFATLDEMKEWLIGKGYSEHASQMFIEDGYVPSMVMTNLGIKMDIHSFDLFPPKEEE